MNKGRYEQLGEPETLYERPKTRFVAGFLGISNLISVKPDGTADSYAVLRLPDGTAARAPQALLDGREGGVALGVRPEKIRLFARTDDIPANLNRIDGVVRDASYIGVSTQYIVELRDERRLSVFEQNVQRATKAELWAPGEEVTLAWSPDHSFIVPDEPGVPAEQAGIAGVV
jgi:spermidine/putrescine transport system ATP-binding protein